MLQLITLISGKPCDKSSHGNMQTIMTPATPKHIQARRTKTNTRMNETRHIYDA